MLQKRSAAGVTTADIGTWENNSFRANGDIWRTSMRSTRPKKSRSTS